MGGDGTAQVVANGTPIVAVHEISKRFPGVQALDGVSLAVQQGEIHALIGENGAGKSTMMNILAGELEPDGGRIVFDGREVTIPNPFVSQQLGISVVYQELALCPNLSIAENIALTSAATTPGLLWMNRRKFAGQARGVLATLGLDEVDVNTPVGQLTVAQQQLVEIAKAISGAVKLLILDEPNSALTPDETAHLFAVLRQLKSEGVGIIYVSHRLEEVLRLADRITVLRDGKWIETLEARDATVDGLIARMVGRAVESLYHREGAGEGTVVEAQVCLAAKNLSSGRAVREVSFAVRAGEVVGIAGLPDSGKDELIEVCFGLRPYTGSIEVQGKPVTLHGPDAAIAQGMAFIPADRRRVGALLAMNVRDNVVAASLGEVSAAGFLQPGVMRALSQDYVKKLDVRVAGLGQQMATLSGGNQQKVILARGMATHPHVLLLHEPTRGIDVGAKAEIYRILQDLAAAGVGIVIASSELPELMGQCDRILVMHQGRITGEFTRAEAAEEPILACAMGQRIALRATE